VPLQGRGLCCTYLGAVVPSRKAGFLSLPEQRVAYSEAGMNGRDPARAGQRDALWSAWPTMRRWKRRRDFCAGSVTEAAQKRYIEIETVTGDRAWFNGRRSGDVGKATLVADAPLTAILGSVELVRPGAVEQLLRVALMADKGAYPHHKTPR
jgi:hypothetical protein